MKKTLALSVCMFASLVHADNERGMVGAGVVEQETKKADGVVVEDGAVRIVCDAADLLYQLCNDVDQQLFISRPRRFGKSLMLSTLIGINFNPRKRNIDIPPVEPA